MEFPISEFFQSNNDLVKSPLVKGSEFILIPNESDFTVDPFEFKFDIENGNFYESRSQGQSEITNLVNEFLPNFIKNLNERDGNKNSFSFEYMKENEEDIVRIYFNDFITFTNVIESISPNTMCNTFKKTIVKSINYYPNFIKNNFIKLGNDNNSKYIHFFGYDQNGLNNIEINVWGSTVDIKGHLKIAQEFKSTFGNITEKKWVTDLGYYIYEKDDEEFNINNYHGGKCTIDIIENIFEKIYEIFPNLKVDIDIIQLQGWDDFDNKSFFTLK